MPMRYCLVTFCKRQSSFLNLNIGNDSWKKISPRQHLRDTKHTDAHKFSRQVALPLGSFAGSSARVELENRSKSMLLRYTMLTPPEPASSGNTNRWRTRNKYQRNTNLSYQPDKTIFRLTPTKRYSIWYFAWNFICHVFWHPGMLSDKYSYMHMSQSHGSVIIYIIYYTILY